MTDKITNHDFILGFDGRCNYSWGSGADRERCGNAENRHGSPEQETAPVTNYVTDHVFVPNRYSRCGFGWYTHGSGTEWVTCGLPEGNHAQPPKRDDPLKSHESTKRVLYHLVNSYQTWRQPGSGLSVPNEFTDDAVRIGEQHLREVEWFPENGGWLAENSDPQLSYGINNLRQSSSVLDLIDRELERLREPQPCYGRKSWREGVHVARQVAADQLQKIRDAYVVESLTRETESLRLYGITNEDAQ